MSEWFKEHGWKPCVAERLPWVRIPPCPPLSIPVAYTSRPSAARGEVLEWLIRPVSKTGVPERVPWVRIPPSPPSRKLRPEEFRAEEAVTFLDLRKAGPRRAPRLGQEGQLREVGRVPLDPRVRVVLRDLVVDQEGPVGGVEEKRLALEGREERRGDRSAPRLEPLHRLLDRTDRPPVGERSFVSPDAVVAAAPPRSGGKREDGPRPRGCERLACRHRDDARAFRQLREDPLEELHPLEPPVSEELEVEHRHDGRRLAAGERRDPLEEPDEVVRVRLERFEGLPGLPRELLAEAEAVVRDAPVAVAARRPPLVELEVTPVARVADLSRPDLVRGDGVAREDGQLAPVPRPDGVEAVGGRAPGLALDFAPVGRLVGSSPDEVRLDEEVADAERREELLQPLAEDGRASGRGIPRPSGAVGALGKPEP